MDPARRELFARLGGALAAVVAKFRADSARHIGDPAFEELQLRCASRAPSSARRGSATRLRPRRGPQDLEHPVAGTLVFEHAVLNPQGTPEQRLALYTPLPEDGTAEKVAELLAALPE